MSALADQRQPGKPDDYYAPDFNVEVEGKPLDTETRGDVIEIKVTLDSDELASVDLKLSNWDDRNFRLKWSDDDRFKLNHRVHVQLGYAGSLVSMFRGSITTVRAEFSSDAAPVLTVRALDPLVALSDSHPPEAEVTYRDKKGREIAATIAQRHHLRFDDTGGDGPAERLVVQRNLDDLRFLKERAARIDCKVFIEVDPQSGVQTLHFGTQPDGRDAQHARTYVLAWGTLANPTGVAPSLIEFTPTISTRDQVQSVEVRGFDTTAKRAFSAIATARTTPGVTGTAGTTGPDAAADVGSGDARKVVIVNAPTHTEEEARRLAQTLLAERAYRFLTATGKAIGLPDLRPGDNVEIHGVGTRFSGTYHTTHVVHTLNASGLLTEFNVRRTAEGERT